MPRVHVEPRQAVVVAPVQRSLGRAKASEKLCTRTSRMSPRASSRSNRAIVASTESPGTDTGRPHGRCVAPPRAWPWPRRDPRHARLAEHVFPGFRAAMLTSLCRYGQVPMNTASCRRARQLLPRIADLGDAELSRRAFVDSRCGWPRRRCPRRRDGEDRAHAGSCKCRPVRQIPRESCSWRSRFLPVAGRVRGGFVIHAGAFPQAACHPAPNPQHAPFPCGAASPARRRTWRARVQRVYRERSMGRPSRPVTRTQNCQSAAPWSTLMSTRFTPAVSDALTLSSSTAIPRAALVP